MSKKLRSNMFRREGTLDDFVINEVSGYAPMNLGPEDFVLDVGANIGAFTRLAADAGVKRIVAVEPDPENSALYKQNQTLLPEDVNINFIQAAAVSKVMFDDPTPITLYTNVGKNKGMHSILPHRGRDTVAVDKTPWLELLDMHPTAVKCDIEGGEYDLEWANLPSSIRVIAIEFHLTKPGFREKAAELLAAIRAQGFTPVVAKEDTSGKRWTSFYILKRG